MTNINDCGRTGYQVPPIPPDEKPRTTTKREELLAKLERIQTYIEDVDCNSNQEIDDKTAILSDLDDVTCFIDLKIQE